MLKYRLWIHTNLRYYFTNPNLNLKYIFVGGLPSDPKSWSREDVNMFLQYCEKEFDLEKIDMEKFQMNGKWMQIKTIVILDK